MKSFFVIKGEPNKWYDQQGFRIIGDNGIPIVQRLAENPIGCEIEIDNPDKIPTIKLSYYVQICKDEQEVKNYAEIQNVSNV